MRHIFSIFSLYLKFACDKFKELLKVYFADGLHNFGVKSTLQKKTPNHL